MPAPGGPLYVDPGSALEFDGSTITGAVGGPAHITLAGGLVLARATLAAGSAIALTGTTAVLGIDTAGGDGGVIDGATTLAGFSAGDTIALALGSVGGADRITTLGYDGTDLIAFDGANPVATLDVGPGYAGQDFSFAGPPRHLRHHHQRRHGAIRPVLCARYAPRDPVWPHAGSSGWPSAMRC